MLKREARCVGVTCETVVYPNEIRGCSEALATFTRPDAV